MTIPTFTTVETPMQHPAPTGRLCPPAIYSSDCRDEQPARPAAHLDLCLRARIGSITVVEHHRVELVDARLVGARIAELAAHVRSRVAEVVS